MFDDKKRIREALNGDADYIKEENGKYFLVNEDGSYKRLIHDSTFQSVRDILEGADKGENYYVLGG